MLNMKIARLRKGITQSELAEKIGINSIMISRYEVGTATPKIDVIKKIAEVLGVTIDELVN